MPMLNIKDYFMLVFYCTSAVLHNSLLVLVVLWSSLSMSKTVRKTHYQSYNYCYYVTYLQFHTSRTTLNNCEHININPLFS